VNPGAVLGVNAWHGDASACLLVDGRLVAAAEEERFRRVKHWAGFPSEAVRFCLAEAGLEPSELGHVAVNRDPSAHRLRKILFALRRRPDLSAVVDRLRNHARVRSTLGALAEALEVDPDSIRAQGHAVEHHRAHLASAFLCSPFETAAVASVDGFGDFSSAMWGHGEGTRITVDERVSFPHSLGLFYLALTQYLGFPRYGDEYKVMGLAAYGEPRYAEQVGQLVRPASRGRFELALDFFRHHTGGASMTWEGGEPAVERAYSERLVELLGPERAPDEPLTQRHRDLAASVQAVYEQAFFRLLDHLMTTTGESRLALAGGCAMNSLANGRILERTDFREVFVQPAAGDAGGALGAALYVWTNVLGGARDVRLETAALGPRFDDASIRAAVEAVRPELEAEGIREERFDSERDLVEAVAADLDEGCVVGWFHGRMEWGPRALGNRSILADPRRPDVQELLNAKIKLREGFRPFAPSILAERAGEWFEHDAPVPFMGQVFPIRPERRARIPAVTHVDGTGRLQTVTYAANPRYHLLLQAFERRTGVPILVNTSFNENEPIVCTPAQAIDCFLRTRMDVLVLEDVRLRRA